MDVDNKIDKLYNYNIIQVHFQLIKKSLYLNRFLCLNLDVNKIGYVKQKTQFIHSFIQPIKSFINTIFTNKLYASKTIIKKMLWIYLDKFQNMVSTE